ncbi:hypothetical protein Rsub_13243 [Raphidocelis subcapitata]|uniref:Pectinesterase inhibitor domain-containing protein n=1 Tax=Raphidocelis subcapitata TaxID=307507 RepID=A0A2V0PLV4_9CHLO|nr:hypothetical protein Rsub_13243 [Raphidocelis subcapitata]|eukprot:GBG00540.1 hypothetical protein Rsub_13243 [Raphidocelis subcapitata]
MAGAGRSPALLGLMVVLLLGGAAAVVPGDIDTCTNTNTTQVPHITSVRTCSSVSLISRSAKGFSVAFSSSESKGLVSAAGACGDAVASGVGAICKGLDPGVSIVSAAQVCANALAAVYSRTRSGVAALPIASVKELFDPREFTTAAASQSGYFQACAAGCNNAQSAAEALAQGAACGASSATGGCAAVASEVRSEVFSRAFTSVATDAWTKACAQSSGAALTETTAMAASAAASFASAIARVAAKACASCPTCKCSHLPSLPGLNLAGRWSEGFAAFAGGKVGFARSLASASSALCDGGATNSTKGETDAAMLALADMVGSAFGTVKASAVQIGGASACSGASLATQLEAVKQAGDAVVSDAAATVYGTWCPKAAAKLTNVELLTKDVISRAANKTTSACVEARAGGLKKLLKGLPRRVDQRRIIAQAVNSNAPLRQKVNEALTEAQKCGCPPSLCLFCKGAKTLPAIDPALGAAAGSG